MNWHIEAKRIQAAFHVESPCFFSESTENGVRSITLFSATSSPYPGYPEYPRVGDAELAVEYSEEYRFYSLDVLLEDRGGWDVTGVMIRWDNSIIRIQYSDSFALPVAEAMFCLGLLTPKIEQELEVTISAHQKAEWTLEYAKRLEAAE